MVFNEYFLVGLSIMCYTLLWNPHIAESMEHPNEQIFLLGIGKELYILLTAMVAHHGKAGNIVFAAVIVHHFGEAPVHLVGFSRLRSEPAATAALWCYHLTLGGDEMFMRCDVIFNGCQPSGKSHSLKPFQAD